MLEIGCGTGHSLKYLGDRKASELWGIDISEKQIEKAGEYLSSYDIPARLICSPMEEDCGIPADYFDYVYSIYGVGWATDLDRTFCRISSYIKKKMVSLFLVGLIRYINVLLLKMILFLLKKSYFDESWYTVSLEGGAISLSDRKLSTYINALTKAGFAIEEMIEESDDEIIQLYKDSDFAKKKPKCFL